MVIFNSIAKFAITLPFLLEMVTLLQSIISALDSLPLCPLLDPFISVTFSLLLISLKIFYLFTILQLALNFLWSLTLMALRRSIRLVAQVTNSMVAPHGAIVEAMVHQLWATMVGATRGSSVACCDGRSPHEDNHVHENSHIYAFLVILVDNIVEELLSDDNKCALWILLLQAGAVLLASP
jgi:hypothetical protein